MRSFTDYSEPGGEIFGLSCVNDPLLIMALKVKGFLHQTQCGRGHTYYQRLRFSLATMAGKASTTSNRLIGEKSPYLLQHATNQVDW